MNWMFEMKIFAVFISEQKRLNPGARIWTRGIWILFSRISVLLCAFKEAPGTLCPSVHEGDPLPLQQVTTPEFLYERNLRQTYLKGRERGAPPSRWLSQYQVVMQKASLRSFTSPTAFIWALSPTWVTKRLFWDLLIVIGERVIVMVMIS